MIENKFLYFLTYEDFKNKLDNGLINGGSVAFVEDASIIWTHGKEFSCGIPISEQFGDGAKVAISQKTLTTAFNGVSNKMEDVIGEKESGVVMSVTPTYFTNEDGVELNIAFDSTDSLVNFETIKFYANGEEIASYEDVASDEFTYTIYTNTVIKCVATLMGVEYVRELAINKVTAFYIGGGESFEDVMKEECRKDVAGSLEGSYDITLAQNDRIIIVMNSTYEDLFDRADMNGFEIPFVRSEEEIGGVNYVVFTSSNKYQEGNYSIYING